MISSDPLTTEPWVEGKLGDPNNIRWTGCPHCGGSPGKSGDRYEPGSKADLTPAEFVQAGRALVAEREREGLAALRRAGHAEAVWKFAASKLEDLPVADTQLAEWGAAIADRNDAMATCARAWEDVRVAAARLSEADRDLLELTNETEGG